MSGPEIPVQDSSIWDISTACDVQLGPLLKELSRPGVNLEVDIDPDAVQEILERLGSDVEPQHPLHIELTHGHNMTRPDYMGLYRFIREDDEKANCRSEINIRMNWSGIRSLINNFDLNTTLVHELQHTLDYNEPKRKYVKSEARLRRLEAAQAFGLSSAAYLGMATIGNYVSLELLQNAPRVAGIAVSDAIAGYVMASKNIIGSLFKRAKERTYHKSPLERRARIAELSARKMPSAIAVNCTPIDDETITDVNRSAAERLVIS